MWIFRLSKYVDKRMTLRSRLVFSPSVHRLRSQQGNPDADKAKRPPNLVNWNQPDYRTKAKGVQLHPTPHVLYWEEAGNGVRAVGGSFGDEVEPPHYRINKGLSGFHETWMQDRKNYFFGEI